MAMKIGLGEITDTHLNNFGMITGGAKPGSSMYETALANLVKKGGDDLRGVSDPLEHIFSAVSRHIEENGMSPNMQKEHARISEALTEGRELSPFNQMMHNARDYGTTLREGASSAPAPVPTAPISAPTKTAAPSMADLKAAGVKVPETIPPTSTADLSPERMSFIETLKAEKAATEEAARKAIPATRQSIEESGYLYHYAPREARDSILSGGFDVSKARTAVGDVVGEASEFATHVPDNSMYFYTRPEDAPSAGTIFGTGETGQRPDLYRVKIEPGMLDDMAVDPRLPLRDGVGSAVIVPSKTGKFQAELIGENAQFGIRGENISPATHDPIRSAPPTASTADDLIEPSIVRKVEDPTREAYDAARAKGEVIVTEPYSHPTAPTSASVVAETNATKTTSLAAEYDTGSTAAKVAEGKPVSTPPPTRKGPGDLGTAAPTKKTVSPHGAKVKPSGPTIDTLSSLSAEEKLAMSGLDEGSETTTKMGARIVAETADNDIKAMQALREIGGKMNTFREGGGKVLSRDAGKALSEAVTQGIKGSKNLRLAALGTAVGLGAYGVSRFQHRRTNSDLQS